MPRNQNPINKHPLAQPGDSLATKIENLWLDKIVVWVSVIGVSVAISIMEWIGWYFDSPRKPIVYTCIALAAIAFSIFRIAKHIIKLRCLHLGMGGERYVGKFLDDNLKPLGYYVFHDICERVGNAEFNIDHVIIGPAGVFVVETKTWSKPTSGRNRIEYDGRAVRKNGGLPDDKPIRQATANSKHVREILEDMSGYRNIRVQPVVLYPGWWIENKASNASVWVLAPKALPKWLAKGGHALTQQDIALYQSLLTKHIRA